MRFAARMLRHALFAATLLAALAPLAHAQKMAKAHLPKKPFKIYKGHLSADQERCLRYALKQWVMYDQAPAANGTGNRNETNDHVSSAGPRHDLSDAKDHARSSRSMSAGEKKAMDKAYGDSSPFHAPGQPVKDPITDDSWFTDDEGAADVAIEPSGFIPGVPANTLGLMSFDLEKGVNDVGAKVEFKARYDTLSAILWIKDEPGGGRTWCYPSDTDGDGFITNADAKCPIGTVDYYMILKHELSHWFSFEHDDGHFDAIFDPPPVFEAPSSLCDSAMSAADDRDPDVADGAEFGSRAGRLYFASNRAGGFGGYDIWYVTWSSDESRWKSPVNCGPLVNSAFNELAPNSGIGDAELYFASNRPGGSGGFDLYRAGHSAPLTFDSVTSLPNVNTSADETSPHAFLGYLLFASNRPGGSGGFDLYVAPIDSTDDPGASVNLGASVNTPFDERDPCVSKALDGEPAQLLYASNRPGGLGGYDVWSQNVSGALPAKGGDVVKASWGSPVNVSALNGPLDDTGPSADIGLERVFLASNRPGSHGASDCFESANRVPRPLVLWDGDAGAELGQIADLTFDVANDGAASVTLQPQAFDTRGWGVSYSGAPLALAAGQHVKVTAHVPVPPGAAPGDSSQVWYGVIPIGPEPDSPPSAPAGEATQSSGGPPPAGVNALPFPANYAYVVALPTVGVPPSSAPRTLALRAEPNPFAGAIRIALLAPQAGVARVEVFDLAGRRVRTIHRGPVEAGVRSLAWDGRDDEGAPVRAGLYLCRAELGAERAVVAIVKRE